MKIKQIMAVLAAFTTACATGFGQGTVFFVNASPALVYLGPGTTTPATRANTGGTGVIQFALFWGATGSLSNSLVQISTNGPVASTTTGYTGLSAATGIYNAGTGTASTYFTGAATAAGSSAVFQVRAWDSTFGTTWEQFIANPSAVGALYGFTTVFTGGTGDPTGLNGPPIVTQREPNTAASAALNLLPYNGAYVAVPEPTTFAFGAMGLGIAWLLRRRTA